jgi:creatinine amidohydrolase
MGGIGMSWKWEEFTSPDFAEAVKAAEGVCVVPVGVLERHGTHLPLGTDLQVVRAIALGAAELEPAVVFPEFFFSQVHEVKTHPGAVALPQQLILALLDNVCEEIARNGLRKIVLLNGHGGNRFLLATFMTMMLERPRDFTLYLLGTETWWGAAGEDPTWREMMVSEFDEHAGEQETSFVLAARSDLVRMDRLSPPATPRGRLAHLPPRSTATWWNADFPDHYAGDATHATVEKGQYLMRFAVERVAEILGAIKADTAAAELEREFFGGIQH